VSAGVNGAKINIQEITLKNAVLLHHCLTFYVHLEQHELFKQGKGQKGSSFLRRMDLTATATVSVSPSSFHFS
jgi:hypothetical protein